MNFKRSLFRIRGYSVKKTTENDLTSTQSIFQIGKGKQGKIGVLCLHGFSTTPANFYEYSQLLIQRGYTVSVPILPGHSDKPEALLNIRWEQWLHCSLQSYDAIRKECDKIFVIGLSLGGLLALQLASKRNDIAKLFLLSPAISPLPLFKIYKYFLSPVLSFLGVKYYLKIAGDVKDPAKYEIAYKRVALNGIAESWDCIQETRRILPSVKIDTIIFQSKVDHTTAPKGAKMLLKSLGSKNKELIWLHNSYHVIPQDFNGAEVLERIFKEMA